MPEDMTDNMTGEKDSVVEMNLAKYLSAAGVCAGSAAGVCVGSAAGVCAGSAGGVAGALAQPASRSITTIKMEIQRFIMKLHILSFCCLAKVRGHWGKYPNKSVLLFMPRDRRKRVCGYPQAGTAPKGTTAPSKAWCAV